MVLDIIAGAFLFVFGVLALYFSIEKNKEPESTFMIILLVSIICIIAGGWILISRLTLALIFQKLVALVLLAIGFFLIVHFPDIGDYQKEGMSIAGIFIGLVLFVIGIYLLIF